MQEITKPNDILAATINNPNASTFDFIAADLKPENTSLLSKDEYKQSNFVKDTFRTKDGKFDEVAFDNAYKVAAYHFQEMSDDEYISGLDDMEYSPFDETRPKNAKTYKVDVEFARDYNPFQQTYSRSGINSIDESPLSLREIAQQSKVYDPETKTWSEESANNLGLINKFFKDTLVYAQYDEDGTHKDVQSGQIIKHKKGDWIVNEEGSIFLEKLGKREVYGKQVVNPMDMLTTDGSFANNFDIFDSDSKDKSIAKTTFQIAAEIAPFLIPSIAPIYGGLRAAISLSSVLPTFYKSLEGMLIGDTKTGMTDLATAGENYMAKFAATSTSDAGSASLFNYEQLAKLTSSIFSQIYEQRAMAGLSKVVMRGQQAKIDAKQAAYLEEINKNIIDGMSKGTITLAEAPKIAQAAISKLPELKEFQKIQSGISKSLSLGYMALTSTADIYGQALNSGYDRRTAGFAALAAASGQYAIMMNNRMGDWFLEKSTGYTTNANKALVRKSVNGYLDEIEGAFNLKNTGETKVALAKSFSKIKNSFVDIFTSPSELGESLFKNAIIEGVEEVTEQVVLDATKGIVDTMGYLGLTKGEGSFGGWGNVFSKEGAQNYLANLVGGILGGAMFEFNRMKIEPWVNDQVLSQETQRSIYQLVANGQTESLINEVNKNRQKLGNNYMSPIEKDGVPNMAAKGQSQADLIADTAISMIRNVDGIMNAKGLALSDSEIIKQAMLDDIIIRDFEKSKVGQKLGVEGLIIDDFRNTSANIMRIQSEIDKLSVGEDAEKNKEAIKEKNEELKIYEAKIADIKEGKKSEYYFTRTLAMLSPEILSPFMVLDRKTFTDSKYEKDYYSLPETGQGITKERIEKEWKEYTESNDLRAKSEIATNAYIQYEQEVNPYIAGYTESGYSIERKKSLTDRLNLATQLRLFDTSDPAKSKAAINHYIKSAKEAEIATGKRIIPWDVITTDLSDKLIEQGLLSSTNLIDEEGNVTKQKIEKNYWNEEIEFNGEVQKRGNIIKDYLNLVISSLPTEALIYDSVSNEFNNSMAHYNNQIEKEIDALMAKRTDDNKNEIDAQANILENRKLKVHLDRFEESDVYFEQQKKFIPDLVVKQNELGLTNNEVNGLSGALTNELLTPLKSYNEILEEFAIKNNKAVADLTNEEKAEALQNIIGRYKLINPNDESILSLLESDNENKFEEIENILNRFAERYNSILPKMQEYEKFKQDKYNTLAKPEIFDVHNYAIDSIIKEIKDSKNLDKELLLKVEDAFKSLIDPLKHKYFKNWSISDRDFLNLLENIDEISATFPEYTLALTMEDNPETTLPKYLVDITDRIKDEPYEISQLESAISNIADEINSLKKTIDKLKQLREIIDNKDKFISNTIYDFLENFELNLYKFKPTQKSTVFSVLKSEELSLLSASEITNYLAKGIRESNIQQAINVIKLVKSVVLAMSTTQIGFEDPYGFIFSRQEFAKKHKIESDIAKLKTIDSATATMMTLDLNRLESKLKFLKELAKNNSGQTFNEQEIIRSTVNKELTREYKLLKDANIVIKEKPLIPDISEILSSSDSDEKKVMDIEDVIYKHYKDSSKEEKLEAVKILIEKYKYTNSLDSLYNIDGTDQITKDIKELNKNDLLLIIVTAMSVNSRDINNKILNILKTEFNKAPFYTQELAVRTAYASIVEPELFAEISKSNIHPYSLLTEQITYVLGSAGVGKTTVVFKLLINLLKPENPNLSMWFVAPHGDQSIKLKDDVLQKEDTSKFNSTDKFSKSQLFEKLNIQHIIDDLNNPKSENVTQISANEISINFENIVFDSSTDMPNLMFIDEVTHFTAIELAVLNEFVKRAKTGENGLYTKIIAAGDPTQNGAISQRMGVSYNVDRVSGTFTPLLTLTVRALNSQKRVNNDGLSAITKKAIILYKNEDDTAKVLDVIGDGVSFKYFLDKTRFNGDMLVSGNTIPKEVLLTLKNIISEKPDTKIGILSPTLDLSSELKEAFDKIGINENNYKVYTEGTVQGSESDYFIVPTSSIKAANIVRSLRRLYTYTTRAKWGTIILNDGTINNEDASTLKIVSESQDFTELINPMNDEEVAKNKKAREDVLTDLLGSNFNMQFEGFKFNNNGEVIPDSSTTDSIFTTEEEVNIDTKERLRMMPKKVITDDYNYMVHTFYNDLNISYKVSGENVIISRNSNSPISYGLDYLFNKRASTDGTLTLSTEEFAKITSDYVNLKYSVWSNKVKSGEFKIPSDDPFLNDLLSGSYKANKYKGELVLRKSVYDEVFNAPFDKEGDIKEKHLVSGEPYLNLYLKLKLNDANYYYIHLGTMPKASTTAEFFDKNVGKNSKSAKAYNDFLTNGDEELSIDGSKISVKTGTRTIKRESEDVKNSLSKLMNMKGLKFYNGTTFLKTPHYQLFPSMDTDSGESNFIKFAEIWKRHTFTGDLDINTLQKMHKKMAGKPYAIVSFVEDIKQAEIIPLKSNTRTFKEIREIIKNPYNSTSNPKSAKELIKIAGKDKDLSNKIHGFTDTLFSGNQVLDLLVNLVVDRPDLFDKFFENGTAILNKTAEQFKDNQDFLKKYLSVLTPEFNNDLLSHITYSNNNEDKLRQVFKLVKDTAKLKNLNKAQLKEELLKKVRGNKLWYNKFWNFFSFRNTIDEIANSNMILDTLKQSYEEFGKTMDAMITYWEGYSDRIFYNVPIRSVKGVSGGYELKTSELDWDNLYTPLTPEGLYSIIDLSSELTNSTLKVDLTSSDDKVISDLKTQLSKIKVNSREVLSSDNLDTINTLTSKIERAKLIKTIIEHNQNTDPDDEYNQSNLVNLVSEDLRGIVTLLDSRSDLTTNTNKIKDTLIKDISELNNLNRDGRNFGITFSKKLLELDNKSSQATEDDKMMLNRIISSANIKMFPQINHDSITDTYSIDDNMKVTLMEFLSKLPESDFELAQLLNCDENYLSVSLTAYLYDIIGGLNLDTNLDLAEDLFNDCII